MQDVRTLRWFASAYVVVLMLACAEKSAAAQFTADMVDSVHHGGQSRTGKIYVKGFRYRMDQEEDGQKVTVLVDQETRLTRVFLEAERMYLEMPNDDPQSLFNDPFQAAKYVEELGTKSKIGSEKVSGYACDIYSVNYDTMHLMDIWVARKLEFPIKVQLSGKYSRTMLLSNIKETQLNDDVFAGPVGYAKVGESDLVEPQLPEWVQQVSSAGLARPPFEQKMAGGAMIRVKIESGKGIKVQGKNESSEESSFTAVPFKDEKPNSDPSMYTFNLTYEGQTWGTTFKQTPYEADEIVVRVNEGVMTASVTNFDLGLVEIVSAGGELKVPVDPTRNIDFRVVNMIEGKSICTYTLLKKGEELSEEVIGPIPFRTYRFEKKNESKKNTLSSSTQADEFVVEVRSGKVLVNVSQP